MKPGQVYKVVELFTTPDELRGWADILERIWLKANIGDETKQVLFLTKHTRLHFVIDQIRMVKHSPEGGSR